MEGATPARAMLKRVTEEKRDPSVLIKQAKQVGGHGRSSIYSSLDADFILPGFAPLHADSKDIDTVKQGVMKRFGRALPKPDDSQFHDRFSKHVDKFLRERVGRLRDVMPFDCEGRHCDKCFCCKVNLPQERVDEYRRAYYDVNRSNRPQQRFFSKIKMFVKSECYAEIKHARLINSRCDPVKVYIGPAIRSIEEVIYNLPYFVKHIPVAERPAMFMEMERVGAHYFILDYTAFESHVTPELMRACELRLYRWCLGDIDPRLADDLEKILAGVNQCKNRLGLKVEIPGRRMSGDMCTSLGNGFTNLMVVTYIMGQMGHTLGKTYDCRVEGDDCLLVIYSGKLPTTKVVDGQVVCAEFHANGFTTKMVEVPDTGSEKDGVAFCGMCHADGQAIRNPIRFFQKFAWALNANTAGPGRRAGLMKAKAMSALAETPQCPLIGVAARVALRRYSTANAVFQDDGFHKPITSVVESEFEPTTATRLKFAKLYGISVDEQLRLEATIQKEQSLRCLASVIIPSAAQTRYVSGWVEVG